VSSTTSSFSGCQESERRAFGRRPRQEHLLQCPLDEIVTVEVLAFDGEKKFPRLNGARVDGKPSATASSSKLPTAPVNSAIRCSLSFIAHVHYVGESLLESFACFFNIVEGEDASRVVCVFSWPFPAISTMSPGPAASTTIAMARLRSASTT